MKYQKSHLYKVLISALFTFWFNIASGQFIQWEKSFGGTDDDKGVSIIEYAPNSYYILNESHSNDGNITGNLGLADGWIINTIQNTSIVNQFSYGGSSVDYASKLIKTSNGFIVAGHSISQDGDVMVPSFHGTDFWVMKLDSIGNKIWSRSFGGSQNDESTDIICLANGNIVLVGNTRSNSGLYNTNHGLRDAFVAMLDSTGNLIWLKLFGGSSDDYANSVIQIEDSFLYVCITTNSNDGDFNSSHGSTDCAVLKLDVSGNLLWNKCFGGSSPDYCTKIIRNSNNNLVLSGGSGSIDGDVTGNIGAFDYWVIEIDTSSTLIRSVNLGGINNESAEYIIQTSDKGYLVGGICSFDDGMIIGAHSGNDIWISKLDSNFTFNWGKCLGGMWREEIAEMIEVSNGTYTILGNTKSNDGDVTFNYGIANQNSDTWVVNLGPTPVNLNEMYIKRNEIKCFYENGELSIQFESTFNGLIEMEIIDLYGRVIVHHDFYAKAGVNHYRFELNTSSAGKLLIISSNNKIINTKFFFN